MPNEDLVAGPTIDPDKVPRLQAALDEAGGDWNKIPRELLSTTSDLPPHIAAAVNQSEPPQDGPTEYDRKWTVTMVPDQKPPTLEQRVDEQLERIEFVREVQSMGLEAPILERAQALGQLAQGKALLSISRTLKLALFAAATIGTGIAAGLLWRRR